MQNKGTARIFTRSRSFWTALICFLVVLAASVFCLVAPGRIACAQSYAADNLDVQASIQQDGSLSATDTRQFALSSADLSKMSLSQAASGSQSQSSVALNNCLSVCFYDAFESESTKKLISIEGVTCTINGQSVSLSSAAFQDSWRESGIPFANVYSFDTATNTLYVVFGQDQVNQAASDSRNAISLSVSYSAAGVAKRFQDVSELTWRFFSQKETYDVNAVSLKVSLPIESKVVAKAGENVWAWAHGPKGGAIEVSESGELIYKAGKISAGSFAEVHTVFPASWLSLVKGTDKNASLNEYRLDSALRDEQIWSDKLAKTPVSIFSAVATGAFISLVALLFAWFFLRSEKRRAEQEEAIRYDAVWQLKQANHSRYALFGLMAVLAVVSVVVFLIIGNPFVFIPVVLTLLVLAFAARKLK